MHTDPVFRNRPIAALAVICLGVFVISVDATIVNVALPTLSRELDADTAQLQWIVDAYTLVMSGLLLSVGSLSDRYGRRGWLNSGLALFAMTSGIAAQVHSADQLIAARAAMGVGAAVIFPTTLVPAAAMRSSMAVAHKVVEQLPAQRADYVRDAVDHAFLDGLKVSTLVWAGIALGAAIVVGWLLPSREPERQTEGVFQ